MASDGDVRHAAGLSNEVFECLFIGLWFPLLISNPMGSVFASHVILVCMCHTSGCLYSRLGRKEGTRKRHNPSKINTDVFACSFSLFSSSFVLCTLPVAALSCVLYLCLLVRRYV